MPYFLDPTEEENQQQQNPGQVQISGASPTTAPTGAGASSTSGGTQNKSQNTGSGYQNLDNYLNTNQAQNFGQQVVGRVGQDISNAQSSMTQASQAFKDQVNQSTSGQMPTADQINQSVADPTHANASQYNKWVNQTYGGPNSLSDAQSAWNQYWGGTQKAQTDANLLGSESGRFSLLDSYFGNPNYNFGQKSLDNLLVQQSGLGQNVKDLQDQATQLRSQGNQGASQLQDYASKAAGQVEQARNQARQAIGIDNQGNVITGDNAGAIGKDYQQVENELQAANDQRHSQLNQLQQDLSSGHLSADELKQLGLNSGENVYNLDLSSYLTPGQDLGRDQVMTPEERAQIQALSQMATLTDTFANGTQQAASDPFSFNSSKLQQDATAAQGQLNQQLDQSKNQLIAVVGQDVGKGYPAANATPEQWYSYFKDYLNKLDSGQPVFRMGGESQIRNAVAQYENAMNTYQPNRVL